MNKPVANTNTSTSSGLQRQRNGANNFSKNYSSVGNYQNRRPYEANNNSNTSSRSNGLKNSNEFSTPKPTSIFARILTFNLYLYIHLFLPIVLDFPDESLKLYSYSQSVYQKLKSV